jgi:hypothetical protein
MSTQQAPSDEEIVKQQWPNARHVFKQAEAPYCWIDDGRGHILGSTPNDFPHRTYAEIIAAAWHSAAARIGK